MEDIIRESNLSAGAIYLYFQSKDQIIEMLADERQAREKRLIEQAFASGEWVESLRLLFRSFSESLLESGQRKERRLGIHLWAEALCNPKVLRLIRRGIGQPLELLSGAIAKAQADGQINMDIDPHAAGRVLIAMFHGLILQEAWDDCADVKAFANAAEAMTNGYFSARLNTDRKYVRKIRQHLGEGNGKRGRRGGQSGPQRERSAS